MEARIHARVCALVAEADHADIAPAAGATNTAAWVRGSTGLTGAESSHLVKQAIALDKRPTTLQALATGAIHTEQANAIVAAISALPEEVAAAEKLRLEREAAADQQAAQLRADTEI